MTGRDGGSGFRHLGDDLVFAGHAISLNQSRFVSPDGSEFTREIVRHPGAVCVVPFHDDGTVTLVKQYRAPLDTMMIEIPAGKRDVAGEPPELTARRELTEEVGLVPGTLELLVHYHNSVGFTDEESFVYLGTDLEPVPMEPQGIEEENMEVLRMPLGEAVALIGTGGITDGKTVIGLTFLQQRTQSDR